ncbi:MAG: mycofactocin biosynthesis glycosyltransferase MftF [Actinomycetota bacterium]
MSVRPPAPAGLRLVADPSLVRRDDGRVLVGGSPFRMMRLSDAGARVVDRWLDGARVRDGAEAALARRLLDAGSMHPAAAPAAARDATVVTPVKNDPAVADRPTGGRRTIVVDDGSTPPLAPIDGVHLLRRDVSGGPGVARTDGLAVARAAGAEFVAFVDADVVGDLEWIERLLGHFDDPAVAAAAPRVVSEPGDATLAAYEQAFSPLDLGGEPSLVAPGRRVSYVPTAALLVRVEAIDDVGGFDPALRYGEDVDLIWRLAATGHTVRYDPSVVVQHRPRASWTDWWRQRRSYGSAAAPLATRHGDAIAPTRAPLEVYGTVAAALVAPLPFVVGAAAGTVAAAQVRVRRALGEHHQPAAVNGAMAHAFGATVAAIPRAWMPIAAVAALAGPRPRRRLAAMIAAVAAVEVGQRRPAIDPIRATVIRVADHAAYGVGVWKGIVEERSFTAIRPARTEDGVRTTDTSASTVGS